MENFIKNKSKLYIFLIVIFVVLIVVCNSFFILSQTEQAIVLRFGKPVRVLKEPGLQYKIPSIEIVVFLDNRALDLIVNDKEVIASDQRRLIVNAFAKFKIINPVKFYNAFRGNTENGSFIQLNNMLESSLRQIVGSYEFVKLLSNERSEIMQKIEDNLNTKVEDYGININDVRIIRADLPKENSASIYKRMQTERQLEAKEIRAEGEEQAKKIISSTDKEVQILLAEANKKSDIIKGSGEAEVANIFNMYFGNDIEFYKFYKSMEVYKNTINKDNTNLIITPNNEFLNELGL